MATGPSWDFSELKAFDKRLDKAPARMARLGIQVSTASAKKMVAAAKSSHPWQNRTGHLEKDIRLIRKGKFGANEIGAEWGVDTQRRGKVGAILEATGWEWIKPAEEKYHDQWVARVKKAAVLPITKG